MKKVSIIDVARHAGVGIGTVSRVLNHAVGVSESTRILVRRAMEALEYISAGPAHRGGPKPRRSPGPPPIANRIELVYQTDLSLSRIDQQAPIYEQVLARA